jgi:hypothetical protein
MIWQSKEKRIIRETDKKVFFMFLKDAVLLNVECEDTYFLLLKEKQLFSLAMCLILSKIQCKTEKAISGINQDQEYFLSDKASLMTLALAQWMIS